MRRADLRFYAVITGLLVLQFLIRAHNPTHQPFFWDENRHMVRAADILEGAHPALNSNGKFLLYIYLAPFHPAREVALHVSRTAVALFSLIGTAAMVTVARRLFNVQVALVAAGFYVVVPFALYYERMALADPMAGALMALTTYAFIRMAQQRSYQWAAIGGALAALATMAKVTVTFSAVGMPVLAAYALGQHSAATGQTRWQWVVSRWRHYWWLFVTAGVIYLVLWIPTLLPAFLSGLQGQDYVLVDQTSIDTSFLSENDEVRYGEFPNQLATMLSWPMVLILIGFILLGLVRFPRKMWLLLGWVVLIWAPTAILVWRTQTRYLMAGVFPLAILFGAGVITLARLDERWLAVGSPLNLPKWRTIVVGASAILTLAWAVLFALPFAYTASTDAASLRTTRWDNRDYYQSPWNGYALIEAMQYLSAEGDTGADALVDVLNLSQMCPFLDLYSFPRLEMRCLHSAENRRDYDGTVQGVQWQMATDAVFASDEPIYLILEQHRRTFEIPDIPYAHPNLLWVQIEAFQRPKGGLWVTVWQVERLEAAMDNSS